MLTGPYGWVRSLRSSIARLFTSATTAVSERAQDDATLVWVAHHVDALRIGGYVVGALLLWFVNLTWLTFFLIALLVAGWQVLVARLAAPGPGTGRPGATRSPTTDRRPRRPPSPPTGRPGRRLTDRSASPGRCSSGPSAERPRAPCSMSQVRASSAAIAVDAPITAPAS